MEKSSGVTAHSGKLDGSQDNGIQQQTSPEQAGSQEQLKKPWWYSVREPGSALQIVIAAAVAIGVGLAVSSTVDDIPYAAPTLIEIPGALWLRALKAAVLPMIVTSMILAVQRLRELTNGGHILARWTIGYYVLTTLLAIVYSTILTSLVWRQLMTHASQESLNVTEEEREENKEREETNIPDVVVQMFESLIPANVVDALATDSLLAVLVTSVVVGYMIDRHNSYLLKAVEEIEQIIMKIIMILIKLAPIGVFFLILPNMFRLDVRDIGQNLGVLIGGSLVNLAIHLFVVLPALYFIFTRKMPYTFWFKNSPAWTTAWGTASSAATLPLTLKVVRERGVSNTVSKFTVPLGCLVNMDGTAIYFPMCVVFLAETQGHSLSPADYVIICLLSTLASIGTTPIPSSSLVLTVMIAGSVDVEITGMYAVIVAIDWFIDRFRTMTNVSGDMYAAAIIERLSGFHDDMQEDGESTPEESRRESGHGMV
ncbi:Sodium:dicarboxylate symporter [Aspergillus egyptiacus]|nr:Sodium:dicarboxylate symporter [Aspergillus egyptiacus]